MLTGSQTETTSALYIHIMHFLHRMHNTSTLNQNDLSGITWLCHTSDSMAQWSVYCSMSLDCQTGGI